MQPPANTTDTAATRDDSGTPEVEAASQTHKASGLPVDGFSVVVRVIRHSDGEIGERELSFLPGTFDTPHEIEQSTLKATLNLLRGARDDLRGSS
jgi:hypothetical protein